MFVGDRKATARITVQHPGMALRNWSLLPYGKTTLISNIKRRTKIKTLQAKKAAFAKYKVNQTYADFLFTKLSRPRELPNVKSVEWSRSTDSDVADCTIVVKNTAPLPYDEVAVAGQLDQPGYYTFDRGGSNFSSRWKQVRNEWFGMLVPDNIIRTYEGYGSDVDVIPEKDPYLVQTGVWIIDTVAISAEGDLTIKCRDIGRLLLDQIIIKPVCPPDFYNEPWSGWPDPTTSTTTSQPQLVFTPQDSSNTPWIGSGTVQGHTLKAAFDGNANTYWLSIGNIAPSRRFAYEWVQGKVNNQSVSKVRFRTKKKGYIAFISLKVNGQWIGQRTINYHEDGIGQNGGDIKYHKHVNVETEDFVEVSFAAVKNVQAVRLTLGNLQNFQFGPYIYRAGVRDFQVFAPSATTTTTTATGTGPAGSNPGYVRDYTDIIKLLAAWGGFFWPSSGRQRLSDGTYRDLAPVRPDYRTLGSGVHGRVWGDFMQAGVAPKVELSWDNFDQKSLMDGISYIRDILGFVFFIDESGGIQWRLANTFNFGCFRSALSANPGYTPDVHLIDERTILLSLDVTLDSGNVRESVYVGQKAGKLGAFAPGYNPNPTGIRRMGGWFDQDFASTAECQRMADMISLAQLYTYRTDRVRIPANPKIQIDDQVRILERVSSEGYIHYIKGISSSLDMESGQWTYDLETHWLGQDPKTQWLFNLDQLAPSTRYHVAQLAADQAQAYANLDSRVLEVD